MADQADPPDANPMRGRAAEYDAVLSLLASTADGQGKILLVEGDPGTGKSLLLSAAAREARERGFPLVTAVADELSRATPLALLLSAVHVTADAAASVGTVLARLEELAAAGPVLVTVDDVQWADQATIHAFRGPRRDYWLLTSLSWILAMARSPHPGTAELLFDLLEDEGATLITPGGRSAPEAQIALISDLLGAVPGHGARRTRGRRRGKPLHTRRGLRRAVARRGRHHRWPHGRASLTFAQVSGRIQILAADRLNGLSAPTRQFTETASVLGKSFRLEDVAEILSQSPGALLSVLDEAVAARLLTATPDGLAFQHEFVRASGSATGAETNPARLLHWQFGHMLLARGGLRRFPRRSDLLNGSRPGDAVALAGLDRAVAGTAARSLPGPRLTWRPARSCLPRRPTLNGLPEWRPRSGR